MATLFLLSTIVSSMIQYTNNPGNQCQTLTDLFNMAKYYWNKRQFTESYRLFFELESTHKFRESTCAWYQIQCLIQLGHCRHAIQKCHEWNKKQPQIATWYLIASDIYMDQFDFTLAWEKLYQASIHVPTTDDAYAEICFKMRITYEGVQQHAHLLLVCRSDILDILPYDIACDVFLCLDLESLVRCSRVSKKWRQFLISSSHLWNELEFSKRAAHLKITTIDTYLSRLKRTGLTKLSIRHQQTDGDGILMALAQHECYRLKSLVISDIICTPALFFNALEYIGSTLHTLQWGGVSIRLNDIIDSMPTICKKLKKLVVHDCFTSLQDVQLHNGSLHRLEYFGESFPAHFIETVGELPKLNCIETLELSGIHGLTASHLANILIRCPNLKKLCLKRCLVNIIPVLNILRFCCPKLQHFEYERNRYCQQFDIFQHHEQQGRSHQQRLLQYHHQQQYKRLEQHLIVKEYPWIQLKIQLTNMLTDSVLQNILYNGKSKSLLETLDLRGSSLITDQGLLMNGQPMKSLKSVCLKDCFGLSAKGIEQLIRTSPLLRDIDLSYLSVINNDILYALSNCRRLKVVNLSYCDLKLVSEDVYKYFVDQRSDTLKRIVLEHTMHTSFELHLYTTRKIKRGVI